MNTQQTLPSNDDLRLLNRNIRIATFSAKLVVYRNEELKDFLVSKARLAYNIEMDIHWQIECHLITTYKAEKILKLEIHDKGSRLFGPDFPA